jgi:N-acetylglucosaminyldiphosphoundecaprenol N-acetyl-beta-D-mannosaminyltransferase
MRDLGLEWLFRLIIQPRLRAKRYWLSLVFVAEAAVKGLMRWTDSGGRSSKLKS